VAAGDRARELGDLGVRLVRVDCPSISTVPIERTLSAASRSQQLGNSSGRGRTSTSERAVISSARWPASTSNAATRVPK
jgi:hypothetical protein